MKQFKQSLLAGLVVLAFAGNALAQPATTAKTFRMYNDATHSVSITAGTTLGTGTFTWPQPSAGIFKSDATGLMSLGAIGLGTGDVTGILNITNGGTGNTVVGAAGTIAYSDGTKINYQPAAGTLGQLLVSGAAGAPTWTSTFPSAINVPFNQISTGTNTTATMTVGAGASIVPGGGTVTANQFVGTGSSSNAVDLGTAEVNGTLSVVNGGTGSTTVGAPGTVAFSNGTQYSFTAAGTAGQVLTSNGAGTPTWSTVLTAKAAGRVPGDGTNFSYTVTPGGGYTASSVVVISVESPVSQTYTITSKTATTFTVQLSNVIGATEFIGYVVY